MRSPTAVPLKLRATAAGSATASLAARPADDDTQWRIDYRQHLDAQVAELDDAAATPDDASDAAWRAKGPRRGSRGALSARAPAPHPHGVRGTVARIELINVARRYETGGGTVTALAGVDLEFRAGEFVVVLGPSGSGKTTLLNLVGALDRPSEGEVVIDGRRLGHASRRDLFSYRRESVSFVFQTFNLFPGLTAFENVRFGADVARRSHAADVARETLDLVGLADRGHHFPQMLSGGEQQRVAIARALATGNPILLADEPTGELDFNTGIQILGLLLDQAASGRTVVVVTHNREIAGIANRVVELRGGRVVADAPPAGGRVAVDALRW